MMKGEWDLPDDRKIHYFEFVRMLFETVEFFSMEENDNVHKTKYSDFVEIFFLLHWCS